MSEDGAAGRVDLRARLSRGECGTTCCAAGHRARRPGSGQNAHPRDRRAAGRGQAAPGDGLAIRCAVAAHELHRFARHGQDDRSRYAWPRCCTSSATCGGRRSSGHARRPGRSVSSATPRPRPRRSSSARKAACLFIDEAYYLHRPENERDYGQEAIEILLQVMENERDDLVVILAGYRDRMDQFFSSNPHALAHRASRGLSGLQRRGARADRASHARRAAV